MEGGERVKEKEKTLGDDGGKKMIMAIKKMF